MVGIWLFLWCNFASLIKGIELITDKLYPISEVGFIICSRIATILCMILIVI